MVDVYLYKELEAAYNDPYWYRPNNGIRTHEQAVQIRDYYNKTELPPYGEYEAETSTQVVTLTPEGPQIVGHTAPNLSVITTDVDMESDTEVVGTQAQHPVIRTAHASRTDQRAPPRRWRVPMSGNLRRGGYGTQSQ